MWKWGAKIILRCVSLLQVNVSPAVTVQVSRSTVRPKAGQLNNELKVLMRFINAQRCCGGAAEVGDQCGEWSVNNSGIY